MLTISTPKEYEQLKSGEIGHIHRYIFIKPSANQNALRDIRFFANSNLNEIHFSDEMGNRFHLRPAERFAGARLIFSEGLLRFLPNDYRNYAIFNGEAMSSRDIDAILEWKWAEKIQIESESDAAEQLERSHKLGDLKNLKRLGVTAQYHFQTLPLLKQLTHVATVDFYTSAFWDIEMLQEFFQHQGNLISYRKQLMGRTVRYTKIAGNL